ncbi:MAG: DUF2974 domain-containing protein [Solobacterium sp.]|nr:DUF2974 domain-containing protein [Solobacterium sp.]
MSLSVKQLLLLNNLMYLEPEEGPFPDLHSFSGRKVSDWVYSIDILEINDPDPEHPMMTTAAEWRDIVLAARKDRRILQLRILNVFTDLSRDGGGCKSAVFISLDTADAVVVFKGTELVVGSAQWKDNFISGNVTDTPHQIRALEWYRKVYLEYHLDQFEITVTGHSKGGNKAKYITVLDDTVDRCVSFDGEGFSDCFFSKYGMEILKNEHKIENHMVDYDYISILLNDIGTKKYYLGYNYGSGGFAENHLANTFMRFDDQGNFWLDENKEGRPAEMIALDEFANSYLRSLDDEERTYALEMMNELLNAVLSLKRGMSRDEIVKIFLQMAENDDTRRHIAYFLAYVIRFEQKYPAVIRLLTKLFERFDMGGLVQYIDLVSGILNWKKQILWVSLSFDTLTAAFHALHRSAPQWVCRNLGAYLEKAGLYLSEEEIAMLADVVEMTDSFLRTVVVFEDGTDRDVHVSVRNSCRNDPQE